MTFFIVVPHDDPRNPTTVEADDVWDALEAYLVRRQANQRYFSPGINSYDDVDESQEWEFAVWEPWGPNWGNCTRFALVED